MSFIRHRSTRFTLPSLAIAAVLALATSALPASAATAQPGVAATCTIPVFFGLHGMNEGPSPTISAVSPELLSFDADQNASGTVGIYPVSYTTVYPSAWSVLTSLYSALDNGENALQADITSYSTGCSASQDKIALVGYSMGAWVINKWIMDHPLEWNLIRAVVLYGDPCWAYGQDKGLVREFGSGYGCMPANYYPFPAWVGTGKVTFGVQSYTMPLDPVSGANWAGNAAAQLYAAVNCGNPKTCSHLDYNGSTENSEGAQFVESKLVG
jgi:hypothetical protein